MADLDEISVAIGRLTADVSYLRAAVDPLDDLKSDVKEIKANVEAMQPVVKKVQRWEQRIIGVSAVISAIVTVVGAGLLGKIKEWFS